LYATSKQILIPKQDLEKHEPGKKKKKKKKKHLENMISP
jgi:hypothetical protein